jgi:hypothetical protein
LEFTRRAIPFPWRDAYLAHAPTSWIAWHAQQKPSPWSARANGEWLRRYKLATLSPQQQSRFHDHLLAWQADFSRPWDSQMGGILIKAISEKRLSNEQAAQFVRGAFSNFKFQTRPVIRVGDPVPLAHTNVFRGGADPDLLTKSGHFVSFNQPPKIDADARYAWSLGGKSAGGYWIARPQDVDSNSLIPGQHKLHVLLVLGLTSANLPVTPTVEHRAALDVQVLPKGSPIGTPISDTASAVADSIAQAIHVGAYHWADRRIFAAVNLGQAPVDRAFEVYVEHNGQRAKLPPRHAKAGQASSGHSFVEWAAIKDSEGVQSINIILVGSGEALVNSTDQQSYWSGTITFPDVPVESQINPAHRTSAPARPYKITPTTNPNQSQP